MTCVIYGALKGDKWQSSWIFLCCVTVTFLVLIDMTIESIFVGFLIPSQIADSVRVIQSILYQRLITYVLPSAHKIQVRNKVEARRRPFSASSYIFVSYFLALHLKWLPEAALILSYVDPLPHVVGDDKGAKFRFAYRSDEKSLNPERDKGVLSSLHHFYIKMTAIFA